MYRILSASKDTYITNKIIENSFRATDANTGQAGTLDLFKIYDESYLSGTSNPIELSRILIKFDLDPLRALTGSILDISHSSFKCFLNLTDVYGGQTTPSNFSLICYPLSKSFDEGFGRDIALFQDLDSANFITASSRSGIDLWNVTGANGLGYLNSANIDIIGSGTVNGATASFAVTQIFSTGEENLSMDITQIVSATLAGILPDQGFRISFITSQETDEYTRFVKRFASRHSTNRRKRPQLRVWFDDSIQDNHENFFFDISGSLFLRNSHRGSLTNLISGSSSITGSNSLLLKLMSGSYTGSFTGSQHRIGNNYVAGIYSASFNISSLQSQLKTEIINAQSATFTEIWSSLDGTIGFFTSSLVIKAIPRDAFSHQQKRWVNNIINMRPAYKTTERVRLRIYSQLISELDDYKASKIPLVKQSEIIDNAFYRIRDFHTNEIVIPFNTTGTKLSTDSSGMYFEFFADTLDIGKVYVVDLLINQDGVEEIYADIGGKFRIEE